MALRRFDRVQVLRTFKDDRRGDPVKKHDIGVIMYIAEDAAEETRYVVMFTTRLFRYMHRNEIRYRPRWDRRIWWVVVLSVLVAVLFGAVALDHQAAIFDWAVGVRDWASRRVP